MVAVSVVIPVYQSADTIGEALESVLNQTFQDFEIIVIDDGSTDGLQEAIAPFLGRIKFLQQKNMGASVARNYGIKHSTGKFIAFLDADDIWLPEKLVRQLPLFDKNPKTGLVYGNVQFLSKGKIQPKTYFDLYDPYGGFIFPELFALNFIPMLSVVVRKQAIGDIGYFNKGISFVEDYDLWLRLAPLWEFDYVSEPVALYRISSRQISKNILGAMCALLDVKKNVYESSAELFSAFDESVLEKGLYNKYLKLALCYMREAKKEEAAKILNQYYQLRGYSKYYFFLLNLLRLPKPLMLSIIDVWDCFYQKPEVGFY